MSFFGGNPLATQVGQLIDRATDASQPSEDWGLFMEICDLINALDEGPKDAIKAIKKKIQANNGKSYTAIVYTLTVLETCVKNCGKRFHVQLANKDFLQEMIKIIGPKNDPPQVVQEKVLSLIQTWADAFTGAPELKEVCKVYQDLKNKGIEFPMTDMDTMAPIHTPARTASSVRSPPVTPQHQQPAPPSQAPVHMPPVHMPPAHHPPVMSGPVSLTPEQMAKLRSELDVVQQNIKVFSEMLAEPGCSQGEDYELLQDLNRTCRQMQQRIVELIERVQNEEVTGELLRLNDELNNVFLRYDRVERLRGGPAGQVSPVSQPPAPAPQVPQSALTQPAPPYPGTMAPPPAASGDVAVANLIDLGNEAPRSQAPPPAAADPFATANTNDIHLRLAGMSVGSSSVSGTLDQINSTPATNAAPAGGEADEFDMFAQSRQSFETSKQNIQATPAGVYNAQAGDQFQGGLGAAVNAKNTGAPSFQQASANDTPSEIEEMEKWLKENPGPQESATSSEFDRFLAERARAADEIPETEAEQGNRTNPRGGRQMQKDDQENALFAL